MAIVTINLSPQAYAAYQSMEKGARSRRISYLIERNYGMNISRVWDDCPRCRGQVSPPMLPGDRRISISGDTMVWTVKGWVGEEE